MWYFDSHHWLLMKASATIFLPCVYSIPGLYYLSISPHIDTLSILKILQVIFLWYI